MKILLRRQTILAAFSLGFCLIMFGCDGGSSDSTTNTSDTSQVDTSQADASQADTNQTPSEETVVADEANESDTKSGEQVLRHAVFFAFKDSSSKEDIQGVTEAFAALPDKIPEIIDFQWGTNNSPEGLDDGFTHCFLLTFADEAGREVYLPHEAHKAFGDVLRPHMEKVFVIDYWGEQDSSTADKELKHAVFFKFKDDAKPEEIQKVEEAFAALPDKIDAIKGFEWGTNNSPESHDAGFTHCFMVTFDSEEGRSEYLPHPDHQAFVEVLKPILDEVRVLDFWDQMEQ